MGISKYLESKKGVFQLLYLESSFLSIAYIIVANLAQL